MPQQQQRLAREIAVVLTVKILLLLAIFLLFFGPERRPDITPDVLHRLLAPAPATPATS